MHVNITEQKPERQLPVSANKRAELGPALTLKTAPPCAMGLSSVQRNRVFDPMSLFPQHRNNMKCLEQTLTSCSSQSDKVTLCKQEYYRMYEKVGKNNFSLKPALYEKSRHWKTN